MGDTTRMFRGLMKVIDSLLATLMIILFIVVMAQVVARYLFSSSISWAEEVPPLLFVWVAYIGAAGALAEGRHLSVQLVLQFLPPPLQRALGILGYVLTLAFLGLMLFLGWKLAGILGYSKYTTLPISRYWLYLAVPVGSIFMIPMVLHSLFCLITGRPVVDFARSDDSEQSVVG